MTPRADTNYGFADAMTQKSSKGTKVPKIKSMEQLKMKTHKQSYFADQVDMLRSMKRELKRMQHDTYYQLTERAKHKVAFDNLTPLYPDERLQMEIETEAATKLFFGSRISKVFTNCRKNIPSFKAASPGTPCSQ